MRSLSKVLDGGKDEMGWVNGWRTGREFCYYWYLGRVGASISVDFSQRGK